MTETDRPPTETASGDPDAAISWTLNPAVSLVPFAYTIENICDSWPHETTCDWCDDEHTKTARYIFNGGEPVLAICLACYAEMYGITPADVPAGHDASLNASRPGTNP